MAHYLIAQLNDGSYNGASILSQNGMLEMHGPAVPSGATDTSYGMGWFVGPINGIPAVHHQGETFNFHSNMILIPESQLGIVVLINGENSMDLMFGTARMASIANGVTSLVTGQQPPSPPANTSVWIVYGMLIGLIIVQIAGVIWSARKLLRGRLTDGQVRVGRQIILPLILNLVWASITLVILPKIMFGLPLTILATGLPDLGYTLLVSGLIALGWGILRTTLAIFSLRAAHESSLSKVLIET
jgi:hypothetical protein